MMKQHTIEEVLEEVCRCDFAEFDTPPKHFFSRRHRKNIKAILFPEREQLVYPKVMPHPHKAVIILMLGFLAIITGAVIILRLPGFTGKVYPDHTQMFVNDDTAPTTIEEVYHIADLPDNFILVDMHRGIGDDYIKISYIDQVTGDDLIFEQLCKKIFDTNFDNEHAEIIQMKVNGYDGFIWKSKGSEQGYKEIVWDNGDYILSILCRLDENSILDLAKSTKVLQNTD